MSWCTSNWPKAIAWIGVGFVTAVVGIALSLFLLSALMPHSTLFSYDEAKACSFSPMILPSLVQQRNDPAWKTVRPTTIAILNHPVLAMNICATPSGLSAPRQNTQYASREVFKLGSHELTLRQLRIKTAAYPTVSEQAIAPVPTNRILTFQLSASDKTFDYALLSHNEATNCLVDGRHVTCNLQPLKLAYSANYVLALQRRLADKVVGTVVNQPLQTISASSVTTASIASGATVYDKPQDITLNVNKAISKVASVTLRNDTAHTELAAVATFTGQTITIHASDALPRNVDIVVTVNNIVATDGSELVQPYELHFHTSGGPRVTGTNVAASGLSQSQSFRLNFDQPIAGQQQADSVQLLVNGAAVTTTAIYSTSSVSIVPTSSLPLCAKISLRVNGTITNPSGVDGDSVYTVNSRVVCYSTFSIGTSVQGRPMTAYKFGNGASIVLYIGATHGNESITSSLLKKWIAALDASPDRIPSNRSIVVIPQINPDGVLTKSRLNAHGIDLNRNFPANDWQTQVTLPGGNGVVTQDGGPSPLSEPESLALANYVQSNNPRLVLTYHSSAAIVEANESGDSIALAQQYAQSSGYKGTSTSQDGGTFDYSTTGAFENWMHDKLDKPVLLVELSSMYNDQYSRNIDAMWLMSGIGG